ncbi:MAG: ribosome biogenesis GTPase Der [Oscillospiraceae bacterium]|jgi:GTP-binding protein|nr:ribosome biogenesis GTPase Der [Oscillospiraceae bacterium]
MPKPIVAIVGRQNVGKSALFNKLIGKRLSITDDSSGVTRDRIYADCEWRNKNVLLVDTGGLEPNSTDAMLSQIKIQSQIAIDSANVIIFVTDIKSGIVSTDQEVAQILQKSGKPIVLCVNKCDRIGKPDVNLYEFYNLGIGDPIAVSSVHGHGTGNLLDEVFKHLPEKKEESKDNGNTISVAIIGKPNVGKSSLVNSICKDQRCIVSDVAGTTRDSVDTAVNNSFGAYNLIDTAGIRRKSKITNELEKYSMLRSRSAIERSDVSVILVDAKEGFTEQDSKVAGLAHEAGKGCVVAINKWDAIEKSQKTIDEFKKNFENNFGFMPYASMVAISAQTGQRINNLFALINEAYNSCTARISTGALNDLLAQFITRVPPPTHKGKRLKIYYMTQASIKPPTFVFFVNKKDLFHFSYQRYLENCIRNTFGFKGTPINFVIREKGENKL